MWWLCPPPAIKYDILLRQTHSSWNLTVSIVLPKTILCTKACEDHTLGHIGTREEMSQQAFQKSVLWAGYDFVCSSSFWPWVQQSWKRSLTTTNAPAESAGLIRLFKIGERLHWVPICWARVGLPHRKHNFLPSSWNWLRLECALLWMGSLQKGMVVHLKIWPKDKWNRPNWLVALH